MIEALTRKKTTQQWLEILEGSGMPYAAINDVKSTLEHDHSKSSSRSFSWFRTISLRRRTVDANNSSPFVAKARNMVTEIEHPACGPIKLVNTPVKYSYSKPSIRTPPPTLGQHTNEVLADLLGMSEKEIEELRGKGVVA